jgi:hypothetical protein
LNRWAVAAIESDRTCASGVTSPIASARPSRAWKSSTRRIFDGLPGART